MRCTALGIVLVIGCGSSNEAPAVSTTGSGSSVAQPARPGGGFSETLAKEFEGSGSGSAAAKAEGSTGSGNGSAVAKAAGSGSAAPAAAGSAAMGSAAASSTPPATTAAAKPASGEKASATDKPTDKSVEKAPDKAGVPAPATASTGTGAKAPATASTDTGTKTPAMPSTETGAKTPAMPSTETGAKTPAAVLIQSGGAPKRTAPVPAELAAIKLALKPNWERDVQEPGTFSLAVKIPGSDKNAVFVFRYGYEDASAPVDRDSYKKWLAEKKILTTRQDRQAGSTWILEGTDSRGTAVFRAVVNWSNKKLLCYGSLYRDAESSKLGDLRDDTIVQAKQICESVAL